MIAKISALLVLCTLFSCKSYLTCNALSKLEKGISKDDVFKILDKPVKEFTLTVNGQIYDVGEFEVKTHLTPVGSGPNFGYKDHIDDFYLLYHKGKLRYWGTIAEYLNSEDNEMLVITKDLYNKVDSLKNTK